MIAAKCPQYRVTIVDMNAEKIQARDAEVQKELGL